MIKIKILDKELTVKEAKQLYNELKEIFENSSQLKRFRYDDIFTGQLDCKGKKKIPEPDFSIFTPLKYYDEKIKPKSHEKELRLRLHGYQPIKSNLDTSNPLWSK